MRFKCDGIKIRIRNNMVEARNKIEGQGGRDFHVP